LTIALICVAGTLIMLWLVLRAAQRLRPSSFRLKASATKWLSLDLEMRSAEHDPGRELPED
jgi:hypothetical protein